MDIRISMMGKDEVIHTLKGIELRAQNLTDPLTDFGERLVRRVGKRLSGNPLKARSGRLRASLTYQLPSANTLVVSAGGGDQVRYAVVHQFGGTIKPKNRQFLTIPFPGGPADRQVPKRAADFQNTFVAKGIIFQKGKGDAAPIPLFILRKSVNMPKRPYMFVEDADVQYLERSILRFVAGTE